MAANPLLLQELKLMAKMNWSRMAMRSRIRERGADQVEAAGRTDRSGDEARRRKQRRARAAVEDAVSLGLNVVDVRTGKKVRPTKAQQRMDLERRVNGYVQAGGVTKV